MNNKPTPETDEQINGKPCTRFQIAAGDSLRDALVPSEFARRLERERDEAREKYDNLATEQMLVVNKLCEERDEAQNASEAFSALAWKLEGERDEAREKLRKVLKLLDEYDQAIKNPVNPFWDAFKKMFNWEGSK